MLHFIADVPHRLNTVVTRPCRCDQSILTGESGSVEKDPAPVDSRKAVYQDKTCIMFSVCVRDVVVWIMAASRSSLPSIRRQLVAVIQLCGGGWQGTVVTAGRARAIAIGTGARTAIGKIHDAMTDQVSAILCRLSAFSRADEPHCRHGWSGTRCMRRLPLNVSAGFIKLYTTDRWRR